GFQALRDRSVPRARRGTAHPARGDDAGDDPAASAGFRPGHPRRHGASGGAPPGRVEGPPIQACPPGRPGDRRAAAEACAGATAPQAGRAARRGAQRGGAGPARGRAQLPVDRGAAVTFSEGLAAALLQISQHAERLSELDTREGEHHQAVSDALAKLHEAVSVLQGTVTDQGQILASLDGLGESVTSLAAQVASLMPAAGERGQYQPIPTVQWQSLTREEHEAAVARIGSWVTEVYRPSY